MSVLMADADITQHGFTTPPHWFGLIGRIDIYGFMLWAAVLAIVLLRAEKEQGLIGGDAQRGAEAIKRGSALCTPNKTRKHSGIFQRLLRMQ